MENTKNSLTRRNFLKGLTVASGAAALSTLGIKTAEALPPPKKWHQQTDVLVVGGGGAGLTAAIWAKQGGSKVLCIEKTATPMSSTTAVSAGGFAAAGTSSQKKQKVEDSFDLLYKDIMNVTGNEADEVVTRTYARMSLDAYEWLMKLGVSLVFLQHVEGHSVAREHWLNASQMMQLLEKEAKNVGVDLMTSTGAKNLFVDPKGRVVGVLAKGPKGDLHLKARRAVILACGGFTANLPMCGEFGGPEFRKVAPLGGPGNTGEGLLMALGLGAATKNMYGSVVSENLAVASAAKVTLPQVVWDGGILVNKNGKRFMRESRACFEMGAETLQQPESASFIIWDGKMKKSPLTVRKLDREAKLGGPPPEAGSLAELGQKLKIDAKQLEETVRRYNSNLDKGTDPDFGRTTLSGTEGKPVKIESPPFCGVKVFAMSYFTKGGLKTDEKCRVLTWDNKVIPGLYAAGEVMLGNISSRLLCMGTGVGGAITFGYIAGKNAAADKV